MAGQEAVRSSGNCTQFVEDVIGGETCSPLLFTLGLAFGPFKPFQVLVCRAKDHLANQSYFGALSPIFRKLI